MCLRTSRHRRGSATQTRAMPTKNCRMPRKVPKPPGIQRPMKSAQNQRPSQKTTAASPVGSRPRNQVWGPVGACGLAGGWIWLFGLCNVLCIGLYFLLLRHSLLLRHFLLLRRFLLFCLPRQT
jgi:hypothetical protein